MVKWLDEQGRNNTKKDTEIEAGDTSQPIWVCGVEWSIFRETVDKYCRWTEHQHGGYERLREQIPFAHSNLIGSSTAAQLQLRARQGAGDVAENWSYKTFAGLELAKPEVVLSKPKLLSSGPEFD
ncbi:hypothetical protein EV356DRAFT_568309 [Viridothelium virens]|uniref:Uncharacterized protein n=1 Tax=Viridothelium virens TaxID=1048519 RepID=A0A6A6H4J6_VIRVR|nr:hypothetical protein EV356DRAFT_568309 [Viridothelium virens]